VASQIGGVRKSESCDKEVLDTHAAETFNIIRQYVKTGRLKKKGADA